jgi:hypothetical protein
MFEAFRGRQALGGGDCSAISITTSVKLATGAVEPELALSKAMAWHWLL